MQTTAPVGKALFLFVVPLMLSNMLQSTSATVSSMLLGQMVSLEALAAVSAFFPVLFTLIAFIIGVGSGSSVLIGQAYGAKNFSQLRVIMGTTLSFTFALGVVLAILGGTFTREVLIMIKTPANIIDDSMIYARITFVAMPVLFLYAVYTTFLRGAGDSRTPFYFLVFSTVLSLLLTPALILGWVGLPPLGVGGAAYASVLSSLTAFVVLLLYLVRVDHPLKFDASMLGHLKIDGRILRLLLKIGIPTSIQMVFISLSEVAVLALVNTYGSGATAAYGAVNQVVSYVEMPAVSLGIAVSVFGAQAIGAGEMDRLRSILRAGVILSYAIGGLLITVTYLAGRQVLGWFLTDPATLDVAYTLLVINLWADLIFGNLTVLSGLMRASGNVFWPTTLSIVSIWGVLVPAAYLLSPRLGLEGIWLAYPIQFAAGLVLQYSYYYFFWRNKQHTVLLAKNNPPAP